MSNTVATMINKRNIMRNYIKIGVAGPVGAGKTALIEKLTREIAS
ncbi:TPA: P-loop NTPase fold protein, partial [Haemophilus influenzae]